MANLLFDIKIMGEENYPLQGPLIVVGNHVAIMEAVMLMVFAPWQIEMLGSADIPHEKFNQIISDLYGYIPVNRGHVDRSALRAALKVLEQKGIIGIFPEGGIWEPGFMRAQTGVAWLSYHSNTPVLPIGFSGSLGALGQALKFKRPTITMRIGCPIESLVESPGIARKTLFENYSEFVMSQVRNLIPPGDPSTSPKIKDEWFELNVSAYDQNGNPKYIPEEVIITHTAGLAKFLHRPAIIKIFRSNLKLQIDALENLAKKPEPVLLIKETKSILSYLENENPYLLSYRFGPKAADEMLLGLRELLKLSTWADTHGLRLNIIPIRHFYSIAEEKEMIQTVQNKFDNWM